MHVISTHTCLPGGLHEHRIASHPPRVASHCLEGSNLPISVFHAGHVMEESGTGSRESLRQECFRGQESDRVGSISIQVGYFVNTGSM